MKSTKKDIREMTEEERQRSTERERINSKRCVSCNGPVTTEEDWCSFCLNEE
jgi:hypothetical protein